MKLFSADCFQVSSRALQASGVMKLVGQVWHWHFYRYVETKRGRISGQS